jgi:cytidine deaminase
MKSAAELLQCARKAAENSYAPYSKFAVGAAIEWHSGQVTGGTNVENISYGLTICAERAAVTAGVSAGERQIHAIAIWVAADQLGAPCGACLQVLSEFATDLCKVQVHLGCASENISARPLSDYLPRPFQADLS